MITNSNSIHQKSIVIVSHSLDETITKCLGNNISKFKTILTIVSLRELLNDYEIFDEVNDSGTSIKWIKELNHISNADYYLLNRVIYIPNDLFSNFNQTDREYAQREFEAYLGFSFYDSF